MNHKAHHRNLFHKLWGEGEGDKAVCVDIIVVGGSEKTAPVGDRV